MAVKEINRTVRFDTRDIDSKYRCRYNDKRVFDVLRINIHFDNQIRETYEIAAENLPDKDSIYFNAVPTDEGYEIMSWSPKGIERFLRKV